MRPLLAWLHHILRFRNDKRPIKKSAAAVVQSREGAYMHVVIVLFYVRQKDSCSFVPPSHQILATPLVPNYAYCHNVRPLHHKFQTIKPQQHNMKLQTTDKHRRRSVSMVVVDIAGVLGTEVSQRGSSTQPW